MRVIAARPSTICSSPLCKSPWTICTGGRQGVRGSTRDTLGMPKPCGRGRPGAVQRLARLGMIYSLTPRHTTVAVTRVVLIQGSHRTRPHPIPWCRAKRHPIPDSQLPTRHCSSPTHHPPRQAVDPEQRATNSSLFLHYSSHRARAHPIPGGITNCASPTALRPPHQVARIDSPTSRTVPPGCDRPKLVSRPH